MPVNKPFVLGLTGGIGCGKSAAAAYLKTMGAAHIDADAISRSLTAANGQALPLIREAFGDSVFHDNGELDRARLAQKIFGNDAQKRILEEILHPLIRNVVQEKIRSQAENGADVIILDVPLLFESGWETMCDEVWTMSVPEQIQIDRVCERDGATREEACKRIAGQMSTWERNAQADRVIDSNRPFEETEAELAQLYKDLQLRIAERGRNGKNE